MNSPGQYMPNMLLDKSGEITPERMKTWSQSKNKNPVMDVTGDRSKVLCCKEQYCIGTWNVRPMDQGKLEAVKQETAKVSINILGISEIKWENLIQVTTVSITVVKNPLKEMG